LQIHHALHIVSKLSYRLDNPTQRKAKNIDYMVNFFETNVLGICTVFNDTLKYAHMAPDAEKIRCLHAIQEMLSLAASSVTSALPQICACCQSALESDVLRTTAIKTWATLVQHIGDEDLIPLLGQTFSIVLRYWPVFSDTAQGVAQEMVSQLFQTRLQLMQDSAGMIPSLRSIPVLSKFENRLRKWRENISAEERLHQLALRCSHESVIVVEYALVELKECIEENQEFIYTSAGNQKPDPVVAELIRCLLDVIVAFKDPDLPARPRIERLSAECLGLIGAVNPNIVESSRVKEEMMVLHNFTRADESADFALFFLEKVLVKQFLSSLDKSQGIMAWCAQELLTFCQKTGQLNTETRRSTQSMMKTPAQQRWDNLLPTARETLIPFLKSRYSLKDERTTVRFEYPLFRPGITFRGWLITLISELLSKPSGENAKQIFSACVSICRLQDISISKFLFPVAVLHIAISGSDMDRENLIKEFLAVLTYSCRPTDSAKMKDTQRQCVETIFSAIDHMTKWLRDKKQSELRSKTEAARHQNRHYSVEDEDGVDADIRRVRSILDAIPPDVIGLRSLEFKSYARSLLYWEQHIRRKRNELPDDDLEPLYDRLQHIYTHIDEPDGMSGISAKLPTMDIDQQILEHRKAGKWTAVQSWYELNLTEKPGDVDVQANLISSLRDSGQYDALLLQVDGMMSTSSESHTRLLPFAVEASWVSGNWDALDKYLKKSNEHTDSTYDVRVGYALSELRRNNIEGFQRWIDSAREVVAHAMTESVTGSIRQCHHFLVQLHALSELQSVSKVLHEQTIDITALTKRLESRLNLMGTYSVDKQYILSVRRAVLQLSGRDMSEEIMSAWLSSAKLARKDDNLQQAYNAVHHATLLNPALATIEHAKLLWHEGQHKNAIRNLNGAISKGILEIGTEGPTGSRSATSTSANSITSDSNHLQAPQNLRVAKAKLLLARWLEASGQTHSQAVLDKYKDASSWFSKWEKAFYYLGRHYNKLYEAEKALHPSRQSEPFLCGEHAKLIVQNYLRALSVGVKYIFQTMPRLLTVWLDLGSGAQEELGTQYGTK
jgi:serine/threonine-protein kinase ATR